METHSWAPAWEGPRALAAAAEKILGEHGIPFAEEAGGPGKVRIRVPWGRDDHAKELLKSA